MDNTMRDRGCYTLEPPWLQFRLCRDFLPLTGFPAVSLAGSLGLKTAVLCVVVGV